MHVVLYLLLTPCFDVCCVQLFRVDGDQSVQEVYEEVQSALGPVLDTYRSSHGADK
jgi:hypothetical protein